MNTMAENVKWKNEEVTESPIIVIYDHRSMSPFVNLSYIDYEP